MENFKTQEVREVFVVSDEGKNMEPFSDGSLLSPYFSIFDAFIEEAKNIKQTENKNIFDG